MPKLFRGGLCLRVLSVFVYLVCFGQLCWANQAFDVARIDLAGSTVHSIHEIRLAIQCDNELVSRLSSETNAVDRAETLSTCIHADYMKMGFIDTEVECLYQADTGRYLLRVKSGQRYSCSRVDVLGVSPDLGMRVKELLSAPFKNIGQEWVTSLDGRSMHVRPLGSKSLSTEEAKHPVISESSFFDQADIERMERTVQQMFERLGYAHARLALALSSDSAIHEQLLTIHVKELGPQTTLKEVRFEGLTRHSSDRLLEYLELKPGLTWNEAEMLRVQRKLFESGRFQYHCVSTIPPLLEPGPVIALIQVHESEKIPLCYETLSDDQEKLRRAALELGDCPLLLGEVFRPNDTDPFEPRRPIVQVLRNRGENLIRLASHLDQIDSLRLELAGVAPDPSKGEVRSRFRLAGSKSSKASPNEPVGLLIAPFCFLDEDFEKMDEMRGANEVFRGEHVSVMIGHVDGQLRACEMRPRDASTGPVIRVTRLDEDACKEFKSTLEHSGVTTKFLLRDLATRVVEWKNGKSDARLFRTSRKPKANRSELGLILGKCIENLFGADSVQYRLLCVCLASRSAFTSDFEVELAAIAQEPTLGPITLWIASELSKDLRHQSNALARLGLERLMAGAIVPEMKELFRRNSLLNEANEVCIQILTSFQADFFDELQSGNLQVTASDLPQMGKLMSDQFRSMQAHFSDSSIPAQERTIAFLETYSKKYEKLIEDSFWANVTSYAPSVRNAEKPAAPGVKAKMEFKHYEADQAGLPKQIKR